MIWDMNQPGTIQSVGIISSEGMKPRFRSARVKWCGIVQFVLTSGECIRNCFVRTLAELPLMNGLNISGAVSHCLPYIFIGPSDEFLKNFRKILLLG